MCGEHGGDPDSILRFYDAGLDSDRCSPFRLPIARVAAAQAAIKSKAAAAKSGGKAGAKKAGKRRR